MAWLSKDQIEALGFGGVGENVLLSDRASFYGCARIVIGDNTRIDDFCVLSAGAGGIELGAYVHVATYSSLIGAGRIVLSNFSGVSSRVSIYSSNDDYSGTALTNPTVPPEYTNVTHAEVFLAEHVIVGAGCVILPGVRLERGVAIGALSMVTRDCEEFWIYSGVPAKKVKPRSRQLLEMETRLNGAAHG